MMDNLPRSRNERAEECSVRILGQAGLPLPKACHFQLTASPSSLLPTIGRPRGSDLLPGVPSIEIAPVYGQSIRLSNDC
jgi:hypothetical protein